MPAKSKKQANLFKAALGERPTGPALKIKNSLSKDKITKLFENNNNKISVVEEKVFEFLGQDLGKDSQQQQNAQAATAGELTSEFSFL